MPFWEYSLALARRVPALRAAIFVRNDSGILSLVPATSYDSRDAAKRFRFGLPLGIARPDVAHYGSRLGHFAAVYFR